MVVDQPVEARRQSQSAGSTDDVTDKKYVQA
jgi:hypothetical protein